MITPKRDEPCWCGSGRPYQTCHMHIDAVPAEKRLWAARVDYSRKWAKNATNLDSQNCYDWMTSLLIPCGPSRIFDIGCGAGSGLVALLRKFPKAKIVSVDENPECINSAKQRLTSNGTHVNVIQRLKDKSTGPRSHKLDIESGNLALSKGVDLIESDILIDEELIDFLETQPKFDAITIWLIGSHRLRFNECDNLEGIIKSAPEYRRFVQKTAYLLADRILRSGGVLHIIDRGSPPSSELLKNRIMDSHRDHSIFTDGRMIPTSLDFRSYSEPNTNDSIRLIESKPSSKPAEAMNASAIISVISVKK